MHHVDAAEALFVDGPLEQLERGVAPVLLDHEKAASGFVAGVDHGQAVLPAGGHGLFRHDMTPGTGRLDDHLGMQAARRADGDEVAIALVQQLGQGGKTGNAVTLRVVTQYGWIAVADGDQFHIVLMLFYCAKVVFGDAAAADDGVSDLSAGNGRKHSGLPG